MKTRWMGILALVACLGAFAYGQNNLFSLGARGGLNLASESGGSGDGWSTSGLTTFGVGALVDINVSPLFAVEVDILYNMKGAKYSFEDPVNYPGFKYDETDRITYLSIPVLARYVFVNQESFRVYAMAGPEASFLLAAKYKNEITGEEADFKDELKSTEFSLDFGAGVAVPVNSFEIRGDVRYGLGLSAIHKEGTEKVTNNVFYINVAIVFPLMTN